MRHRNSHLAFWAACGAVFGGLCRSPAAEPAAPAKRHTPARVELAPQPRKDSGRPTEITVFLDGERLSPDYPLVERRIPFLLVGEEPMLPVRAWTEKGLGGLVLYLERWSIYGLGDDVAVKLGDRVALQARPGKAGEPGAEFLLPMAPRQVGPRVYVPARGLLAILGFSVNWDAAKRTLSIRSHARTHPSGQESEPGAAGPAAATAAPISVTLDGKPVLLPEADQRQVVLFEGRPMLSSRFVQEALKLAVTRWRQRWGVYEVGGLYVLAGSDAAISGIGWPGGGFGRHFALSSPALLYDGDLYIPPAEILAYSGFRATWDPNEQSLRILGGQQRMGP